MVLLWWSNLTLRSQADSLQKSFDVLWISKLLMACIKKQQSFCWCSVQCRVNSTFFFGNYTSIIALQPILYGYWRCIDITSTYMATDIQIYRWMPLGDVHHFCFIRFFEVIHFCPSNVKCRVFNVRVARLCKASDFLCEGLEDGAWRAENDRTVVTKVSGKVCQRPSDSKYWHAILSWYTSWFLEWWKSSQTVRIRIS